MSARLASAFARAADEGRAALVTFVTAGDPAPAATAAILDALVEGGADVIELGVPFSDPSADGLVIQKAGDRALALGIGLVQVLPVFALTLPAGHVADRAERFEASRVLPARGHSQVLVRHGIEVVVREGDEAESLPS